MFVPSGFWSSREPHSLGQIKALLLLYSGQFASSICQGLEEGKEGAWGPSSVAMSCNSRHLSSDIWRGIKK